MSLAKDHIHKYKLNSCEPFFPVVKNQLSEYVYTIIKLRDSKAMKTVLLYTTFATALHVYFGKLTEITIINQHFIPILTFVMKCLLQKNRIKKGLDFLLMTPPKKIEYFSFASKTKYKTPADRTRPTPPCQITNVNFFTCRYFNSGNPAASLPAEGRCDYKTTSVKSSYRTYFTAFFSLIDIGCCYFITTGPLLFITHGNT